MKNNRRSKRLERKLIAVQEIKKKYVGTQEAWEYLRQRDNLYEVPDRTAREINDSLKENGIIHYPATRERVLGYGFVFEDISASLYESAIERPGEIDFDIIMNNPFGSFIKNLQEDNEKFKRYIAPRLEDTFHKVQSSGATDKDFGLFQTRRILSGLNLPKEIEDEINFVIEHKIDWSRRFSKENLTSLERRAIREIYFSEINVNKRAGRILRDQVDTRCSVRREIIEDLVDRYQPNSYEELLRDVKRLLAQRERRKIKFTRFNYFKGLQKEEELVKRAKFLVQLVASDKNFIKRMIRR